MKYFAVFFLLFMVHSCYCSPCKRTESLNITNGVVFDNGTVLFDGVQYTRETWYDLEEDGVVTRYGCPCIGRTCLWKCCGEGQAFFNKSCLNTDYSAANPFNPPVHKGKDQVDFASNKFFYMYTKLCTERYLVDPNTGLEDIFIQENASLYLSTSKSEVWLNPSRYCVDMMTNTNDDFRMVALVCYPDKAPDDDSPVLYITYAIGLMISIPFLLATFLVYAFIPELRNLHGMCLMAYCGGLIVAYMFLAYLKLHSGKIGVAMTGCYIIAFIVYYAFQTSFFWLNVMCFDIWRTFSGYRGSSNKRREKKRFVLYGAYAWGLPFILTIITITMQFADVPNNIITPGFGAMRCWFTNWMSELVYFLSPVLVLVVCNVVLFSVTAHRIRSIRQETAILKGAESARSDKLKRDKQRFGLYLKLFMVMGVNWTVEIISFSVGGSNWYWILIDISNIALGAVIFLIFVWKKKVRNLVAKKWRSIRGIRNTESAAWATRSSSAPTEDTRISNDETALRLKEIR
ncbi:G-protein coupled receptor Mth2 [Papilio machaon]|uniref:G-protein coupled receptor Mth2 n=1 Tax=Papilio machaon TaxID=76193 RepID=UPI001E665FB0|nr:G-protein coupled receptor Mth2 [Papilio machaon]